MAFDTGGGGKKGRAKPDMNVTPLVDVVLVLLIIFMVVTPMLAKQFWVHVPPEPEEDEPPPPPDPDAPPSVVVTVATDGTGVPELVEALEERRARSSHEQGARLERRRRAAVERHLLDALWLRVRSADPELRSRLVDDVVAGSRSTDEAVLALVRRLGELAPHPG